MPDAIRIDTSMPAAFPNGRPLDAPVVDVTLALVLLDLGTPGDCGGNPCSVTTFAELPLNPPANDVPFSQTFPFLAAPHVP